MLVTSAWYLTSLHIVAEETQRLGHAAIHRRAFIGLDGPVEFERAEVPETL